MNISGCFNDIRDKRERYCVMTMVDSYKTLVELAIYMYISTYTTLHDGIYNFG